MELSREKIIFLDCQTTGMQPSTGQILELAWIAEGQQRSFLLRLPEGDSIPYRVREITGITEKEMEAAVDEESALVALEKDLKALGNGALVVAHYAQFEKSFLKDMFRIRRGLEDTPFPVLCTYRIAQRLFPEIPSRNIRALAGYFKLVEGELKRAPEHARATEKIWDRLADELARLGIHTTEELESWQAKTKTKKPAKIEYRIDRLKRLELSKSPGIYKMLSQTGQVLYVGKATSLRDRVNSYFRGQKGRNRKKLELLAQVWDIEVTECPSPLEAALLESEEIKRLNPPYNVSLKVGRRKLAFYSRDLSESAPSQSPEHPLGPLPASGALDLIGAWQASVGTAPAQVFYEPVPEEVLVSGYKIFCERNGLDSGRAHPLRTLVCIGMRELRVRLKTEEDEIEEGEEDLEEEEAEEAPRTPEEIAGFYFSLLVRAAADLRRARKLTRLLNAKVVLGKRVLEVRRGRLWREGEPSPPRVEAPWMGLDIVDYDRMSVLLTEVNRHSYPVESAGPSW